MMHILQSNRNMELIDILVEKKELLTSILKIAKKQELLLNSDDIQALLEVIQVRQNLISEISILDSILTKNKSQFEPQYETSIVKEIIAEIHVVLQEIAGEDADNCLEAEKKVIIYREHIRNLKQNKSRLASYQNQNTNNDGVYFDAKK